MSTDPRWASVEEAHGEALWIEFMRDWKKRDARSENRRRAPVYR